MMEVEKDRSKKLTKTENTLYNYSKFRAGYGKWCSFHDHDTEVNIDIQPDENLCKMYERRSEIQRGVQATPPMSSKEINTSHIKNTSIGVNHVEGGWPKDISYLDQELTVRYRKKAEREESYIPTMHNLCKLMEDCIEQNNSIDIYVRYFSKEPVIEYHPDMSAVVAAHMGDPSGQNRAVSCVSWHPVDSTERILVAHCDLDFVEVMKPCNDSYIWWIENPFQPEHVLSSSSPMLTMECNYKDLNLVAGGQHNGQVAFFDIRKSIKPIGLTEKNVSHLEPVHALMWIQSKTGFECFTTSTDGQVLWWDMRNLNESMDQMVIDHTKNNNLEVAEGGVVLEYSNTVPTKFMVGTEKGNIYSCTRKAKLPSDKIGQAYSEHIGPIYLLQRNPYMYKLFLTVGDYHANIWAEDFSHAPIWKTPLYNCHALHGGWSPPRPSIFFITKADGTFDIWDLMYKQKEPEYTIKLSDKRLFCMSVQEKGEFVAVGSEIGETYVLQLSSEVFEPQNGEKTFFSSLIDRECRREKFLYDKEKDRKLAKTVTIATPADFVQEKEEMNEILEKTTEIFYQTIAEEMKRLEKFKLPHEIMKGAIDCEEDEEEEEGISSLMAPKEMPYDLTLPLYQMEALAQPDIPDQPMDKFEGTVHKKRFKIGHCADIAYPPEQNIDFQKLKTCDCPALMPHKSEADEVWIEEPVITKVNARSVLIEEVVRESTIESIPLTEAATDSTIPLIKPYPENLDGTFDDSGHAVDAWVEAQLRKQKAESDSADLTSLGFSGIAHTQGPLIGVSKVILIKDKKDVKDPETLMFTPNLRATRDEEMMHLDLANSADAFKNLQETEIPQQETPEQANARVDTKTDFDTKKSSFAARKSPKKSIVSHEDKEFHETQMESIQVKKRTIQFVDEGLEMMEQFKHILEPDSEEQPPPEQEDEHEEEDGKVSGGLEILDIESPMEADSQEKPQDDDKLNDVPASQESRDTTVSEDKGQQDVASLKSRKTEDLEDEANEILQETINESKN